MFVSRHLPRHDIIFQIFPEIKVTPEEELASLFSLGCLPELFFPSRLVSVWTTSSTELQPLSLQYVLPPVAALHKIAD